MVFFRIRHQLFVVLPKVKFGFFNLKLTSLLKLKQLVILFIVRWVLSARSGVIRRPSIWCIIPINWSQFFLKSLNVRFLLSMCPYRSILRIRASKMAFIPLLLLFDFLLLLGWPLLDTLLNSVEWKDILKGLGETDAIHFELP